MHQPSCFDHRPERHPDNPKLPLCYDSSYAGMAVYQHPLGPLIEPYLKRSLHILRQAELHQSRTFICRYDLRFPAGYSAASLDPNNALLQKFWLRLKRELIVAQTKYRPCLRYLWAREQDTSSVHHYHLMLLLNYNAICTVGNYAPSPGGGYGRDNLTHRVARSWAHAVARPLEDMEGRAHVCKDRITQKPIEICLHRNDRATFAQAFYVASYLCKAYSKPIAEGGHPFGSSRL